MRSHLFSLHPSIWEIVESGMQFDSTDSPIFIVGTMLRRRRSCRKKQFSAEAVRMR
jgi:hypothetical protein